MRKLTGHIGKLHDSSMTDLAHKSQIKRVLISRPNHRLGNLILITPLIQEITTNFPECKIDLFLKGDLGPTLFKNYKNIDNIFCLPKKPFIHPLKYIKGWLSIRKHHYDLVINVVKKSSSGRLSVKLASARHKLFGDMCEKTILTFSDHEHIAKYPVYNLRNFLTQISFEEAYRPIPSLNIKLSSSEIAEGAKLLRHLVNNSRKTICLFTYATGEKCFSDLWWANFYERLKMEFPQYNIIEVLPVQNVSKLQFNAPTFYSKNIREIGALIANTAVFIGADSGIMHLANSVQIPTIGLFKVSNEKIYKPYNNSSAAIKITDHNTDKCIKILNRILTTEPVELTMPLRKQHSDMLTIVDQHI